MTIRKKKKRETRVNSSVWANEMPRVGLLGLFFFFSLFLFFSFFFSNSWFSAS